MSWSLLGHGRVAPPDLARSRREELTRCVALRWGRSPLEACVEESLLLLLVRNVWLPLASPDHPSLLRTCWCPEVGLRTPDLTFGHLGSFHGCMFRGGPESANSQPTSGPLDRGICWCPELCLGLPNFRGEVLVRVLQHCFRLPPVFADLLFRTCEWDGGVCLYLPARLRK